MAREILKVKNWNNLYNLNNVNEAVDYFYAELNAIERASSLHKWNLKNTRIK